ncbi:MAG: T9SS type A sorting domain-containing protein [Bacteroidota bacterium]
MTTKQLSLRCSVIIFFSFFYLTLFAQKEDYVWMMGGGRGNFPQFTSFYIDFNSYPPKMEGVLQNFRFNVVSTSITDMTGQLLCYSNGVDIKGSDHGVIDNGNSLTDSLFFSGGLTAPQGTIILPLPEDDNKYFFLTSDIFIFELNFRTIAAISPLYYAYFDMSLNGGSGEVTSRDHVLNTDTLAGGQFVATRHGNGRDWWLICPKYHSNRYHRYLLTLQGIQEMGHQDVGTQVFDDLGSAIFSPDGRHYVRYNSYAYDTNKVYIDLYDFDRCNGLLSNHRQYEIDRRVPGGVCFSPNSQYLYVSLWDEIWQYDMTAPDIFDSGIKVAEYDGFLGLNQTLEYPTRFFMMQNTPDGRIIINIPNVNAQYLHTIQYPDRRGMACEVQQHSILLPAFNTFTLPNFPNYRLGPEDGSACDTLGLDNLPLARFRFDRDTTDSLHIVFTDLSAFKPEQWRWDFGDDIGSSFDKNNEYHYAEGGRYEVCLEVSNTFGSDRTCQTIEIGQITAIQELSTIKPKIFPNPFSNQLLLDWSDYPSETQLQITDVFGRVVYERQLRREQLLINTNHWGKGIYFYQISQKDRRLSTGKLLKQ